MIMKKQLSVHFRLIFRTTLILGLLLFTHKGFSQLLSDESLYANGHKSYISRDWIYASVYLFAYIERNPGQFTSDPGFKAEVISAYDFAVGQLNSQTREYNNLLAKEKQREQNNNNGLGSSTHGLEVQGPPLREPARVRMITTNRLVRADSTNIRQKATLQKVNQ
jgi:hypothetical protein